MSNCHYVEEHFITNSIPYGFKPFKPLNLGDSWFLKHTIYHKKCLSEINNMFTNELATAPATLYIAFNILVGFSAIASFL